MHTKESIAALLARSDMAVWRGLIVLYKRQTSDEQQSGATHHLNGRGFNGRDANFGTDLAKKVMSWNPNQWPRPLTGPQTNAARNMLRKYAGQLAKVANEKAAATTS